MTNTQKLVFQNVLRQTLAGRWYRAAGNGERVTLASLYRRGALIRRCHRGVEGAANAAHEYRVSPEALEARWYPRDA
jgi:hypothetical protein